jgi:hypothetical protein
MYLQAPGRMNESLEVTEIPVKPPRVLSFFSIGQQIGRITS